MNAEELKEHRDIMRKAGLRKRPKVSEAKEWTAEDIIKHNEEFEKFVATGGKGS